MSAKKTCLAALLLLTLSPLAQAQAQEQPWDWMVAPYAWFAGISSDVAVPAPPPGGNAEFGRI